MCFSFKCKFQIFNSTMRSPPPEIMGQYMYGQQPNYFGSTYNSAYDTSAASALGMGRSSPPRRRYSIGGLPTASMTDYLNLMQNASESAHISNLINETSKSITRSSQILNVTGENGEITGISSYPTLTNCDSAGGGISGTFLNDNILNFPIANFSSHPNIYSHRPNYNSIGGGIGNTMGTSATGNFYDTTNNYLSHQKPFSNYFYSRPLHTSAGTTMVSAANPYGTTASAYLNPLTSINQLPYQSVLSQSRHNLFIPSHHTSNPALSTSNWIPSSHNKLMTGTYSSHLHNQPHHHHHNHLNHPFSSGYSNQHFDHHYYQVPLSKLDLDYSKQGDNKRQVSFKFDVDTLSIES